jgi:predicted transcriptional regulator
MSNLQAAKAPDLKEDDDFLAAVKAGQASLDAGRSVPYEDVRRWLLSWGTDKELPPPECP